MKVLVITSKDGPNLFIENAVKELAARGHEISIYAEFLDDTSIRMFQPLMVPIYPLKKLSNKSARSFDVIFCPVQSIRNTLFLNKYVFSYCNMNPAFDHVRGADFVFTLGELQEPYERTFSYMPVGMPKNDTAVCEAGADSRRILVIDSGHFPFAESGKKQVAGMVLEMCRKFPENEICVKPRWLPETDPQAMTHINLKHLYEYIDELCEGRRPENLNLLMEHLDLQELIDGSRSVVTLCTTAYLDVALRGKGLVVAKGFDNEDMYQVRGDYFDRVYAYAEDSGCVVDYHDVCRHLPDGITCRPEHLTDTFAYTTGASARVAEVMEYIYDHYLEYDLYPSIDAYRYESYREKIQPDPQVTMETLKRWRMYCTVESVVALNRSISPVIDWTAFIQSQKALCKQAVVNKQGLKDLRTKLQAMKYRYIIDHAEQLRSNEIDRSFYFAALFYQKKYEELLAFLDSGERAHCVVQYYCGLVFYESGDLGQAAECLSRYLDEVRSRDYLKYFVEDVSYKRPGIVSLLDCYYRQGNLEALTRLLLYYLNDQSFKVVSITEQKHYSEMIKSAKEYSRSKGDKNSLSQLQEKNKQMLEWTKRKIKTKIKQKIDNEGILGCAKAAVKMLCKSMHARTAPIYKKVRGILGRKLRHCWYVVGNKFGWYDQDQKELLTWKNRFLGQSCIIIGNGPSLQAKDLEALQAKGYSCFSANKIYKIFDQTSWRPDFYACTDHLVFNQNYRDIFKYISCPLFLHFGFKKKSKSSNFPGLTKGKEICYLKYFYHKGRIKFRPDCKIILSGGSVTFVLISLAWMMGFRNIYLIGCDHNYGAFAGQKTGNSIDPGAGINQDYFAKNYMKPGELINVGDLEKATEGYRIARKYIERHGGHLYNATRGGKLEVLERVDLDELLEESQENLRKDMLDDIQEP